MSGGGDDGLLHFALVVVGCVYIGMSRLAECVKWLLVDVIVLSLIARVLRVLCGARRWERLVVRWKARFGAESAPPQPSPLSLPNLVVYAAVLVFGLALALQVATVAVSNVRFAYTTSSSLTSDSAAPGSAGSAAASAQPQPQLLLTSVEVTRNRFLISQTLLAADRSRRTVCQAAFEDYPTNVFTPLPCSHDLPTSIRLALSLTPRLLLFSLVFGLLSSAVVVCRLRREALEGAVYPFADEGAVVLVCAAPFVVSLSPGALLFAVERHLAAHYQLTAVGDEVRLVYWATAVSALSWTLALCRGAVREERIRGVKTSMWSRRTWTCSTHRFSCPTHIATRSEKNTL